MLKHSSSKTKIFVEEMKIIQEEKQVLKKDYSNDLNDYLKDELRDAKIKIEKKVKEIQSLKAKLKESDQKIKTLELKLNNKNKKQEEIITNNESLPKEQKKPLHQIKNENKLKEKESNKPSEKDITQKKIVKNYGSSKNLGNLELLEKATNVLEGYSNLIEDKEDSIKLKENNINDLKVKIKETFEANMALNSQNSEWKNDNKVKDKLIIQAIKVIYENWSANQRKEELINSLTASKTHLEKQLEEKEETIISHVKNLKKIQNALTDQYKINKTLEKQQNMIFDENCKLKENNAALKQGKRQFEEKIERIENDKNQTELIKMIEPGDKNQRKEKEQKYKKEPLNESDCIMEKEADLESFNEKILKLQEQLEEKNQFIADLEEAAKEKEKKLVEKENELNRKHDERQKMQDQVDQILTITHQNLLKEEKNFIDEFRKEFDELIKTLKKREHKYQRYIKNEGVKLKNKIDEYERKYKKMEETIRAGVKDELELKEKIIKRLTLKEEQMEKDVIIILEELENVKKLKKDQDDYIRELEENEEILKKTVKDYEGQIEELRVEIKILKYREAQKSKINEITPFKQFEKENSILNIVKSFFDMQDNNKQKNKIPRTKIHDSLKKKPKSDKLLKPKNISSFKSQLQNIDIKTRAFNFINNNLNSGAKTKIKSHRNKERK